MSILTLHLSRIERKKRKTTYKFSDPKHRKETTFWFVSDFFFLIIKQLAKHFFFFHQQYLIYSYSSAVVQEIKNAIHTHKKCVNKFWCEYTQKQMKQTKHKKNENDRKKKSHQQAIKTIITYLRGKWETNKRQQANWSVCLVSWQYKCSFVFFGFFLLC